MAQAINSILVILVSLALLIAGSGLLGTLLAVRMTMEGFQTQFIGPILAFHSLGFVIGTRSAVGIIRRVGHIRSFAAFAAIASCSALLHPMEVNGFAWAALRMVTGFCSAGLMMVMESWINDRTSNEMRGTIMAFYMATNYLAQGAGQFTLGFGDPGTTYLFMVSAVLISASLVPLALTRSKAPLIEQHEPMGLKKLYGVAPIGIVGAFLGGCTMSGYLAVLPVYAQQAEFSVSEISVLMGCSVMFGMVFQWPVGHLSDRHDRRAMVVLLALLAVLCVVPLILGRSTDFLTLLLLGGLFVGMAGTVYPMCVALTNDYLEPHQMVSASASLLLIFGIGTVVGPIGGSLAMEFLGGHGLFMFTAGTMGLLALYGLYRYRVAKRIPVEQQQAYVPVATSGTPVIMEIDPRNADFEPHVIVPPVERRAARADRRQGPPSGGRRRTDAADFNE